MGIRPPLPDEKHLPRSLNGWVYKPDADTHGHYWLSEDGTASVCVNRCLDQVSAKVSDERFNGFETSETIEATRIEEEIQYTDREQQVIATIVDEAIEWMAANSPSSWSLPAANEAVFSPPQGYSLAVCYLENQDITLYYERDDVDGLPDRRDPDLPEEHRYLVVRVLRGSGNATIAVSPWKRAHDHEMMEVVDPPEECGLDVALKLARDYAGPSSETTTVGQSGLQEWSKA
jgi:hypothetical protein